MASWQRRPPASVLTSLDDVENLKQADGKAIYLMGGGAITAAAMNAGLVDELRLTVYPVIAGGGHALFPASASHRELELRTAETRPDGLLSLVYAISDD